MLSVAKLTPGQESYYERSVSAGMDDYYAGRGESPGVWVGRGAAELDLDGIVEEGQLGRLIGGRDPLTSAVLRSHPPKRRITVERIEVETGRRWLEQKTLAPVAGFDLVFSVPKSVSLLHALGDEETRLAITQAHLSAWQAALAYLEEDACVLRRGKNGVVREHGGGFVAAAYQHRTSRAEDPHLHTHVIVANMAQSSSDGEWRALDGEAILKTYRLAAGYLYEAQLRYELSRSLGFEWATPEKGWAELRDVPRTVIDAFSRRRAQIKERMAEQHMSGFHAAKVAALATRERKENVDLPRLREEWAARAAEHGLGQRELQQLVRHTPHQEPTPAELLSTAERLLGPEGLTEKRTSFSEPELAMAWAQAHTQGAFVERIRELGERLLTIGGVQRLTEPAPGRPASYSTRELLELERGALELVERGRSAGVASVPAAIVEETVTKRRGAPLSAEQEAMVRAVLTSPDRVVCVVGPAGAGKTTATHALAEAFNAAGAPVLGAAPSGIAAERLQDETGIPSRTLHRLLADARRAEGLPEGCVLIVDEAAMAETRVLALILAAVEQAGGKAILIGDPQQLPAVGAGGLFAAIVERHGAIELTENQRQRDELERRALQAVRDGLGRDYLAFADQRGRLVVANDPLESRARLLGDWWQHARTDLAGNLMLAHRRTDVAELNAHARALMQAESRLGDERLLTVGHEFRAGDRILCRRNSDALDVRNGTRGTVEHVDRDRRELRVRTDRGDHVVLSTSYLEAGHVRHAYALTGHASQGLTVERAFVLGGEGAQLQEWGYVALSRAYTETRLYLTESTLEPETHAQAIGPRDSLSRFAQALESPNAERLALEHSQPSARSRPRTQVVLERANPTSPELRFLEQDRLATERLREGAQRRLAEAEREVARLPFFIRGRRRNTLESRARHERQTLSLTAGKLDQLQERTAEARTRASLEPPKPPARRERARAIEREPTQLVSTSDRGQRSRPMPRLRSSSISRRNSNSLPASCSRPSAASIRPRSAGEAISARIPLPRYSRLEARRRSS
ncbi:MAG: MobF family relaxase [Gaiellaceae bacterium]